MPRAERRRRIQAVEAEPLAESRLQRPEAGEHQPEQPEWQFKGLRFRGERTEPVKATQSGEKDTAQCPPLRPDVSGERSDLPPLTAPILNPLQDAFPTDTSSVRLTNQVVSANVEARRLKKKKDKKNSPS